LYDMNNPASKAVTVNTYNYKTLPIVMQSKISNASNGDTKKTVYHYAGDFAPYGFISSMQQANDIATPVEIVNSRIDPSSQELVSDGVITSYKPAQLIKDMIYTIQSPSPVPVSQFTPASMNSSGVLQMDNSYQPLLHFSRYDAYGNIIQEQKVNDLTESYLWDYSSSVPIAEIKNADSASVAYTSFEADGTGNWTFGSGSVNTTAGFTGHNSYNLTGTISKSGLNSGTTYLVSYWAQGGALSVSGTIAGYPQKGKTITINNASWTLYVHKVMGQSTITVSGTGTVDELRLYPATAQMTTYTHDPLIGTTSQTDVANRTTYYEYDGLARLKRVRDQDYNILKTLEYQYQATVGCGAGCYILPMQTFAGTTTLGYPVGVFNVNGKRLGNATTPDDYVTKWNSDAADNTIGTLAKGGDSVHFNLTAHSGQVVPSYVTGCRYYQYDLPWHSLDCVIFYEGDYVDWGDGTGMRIGPLNLDTPAVLPPNTAKLFNPYSATWTFTHTWPNDSLKTLTFYHSDDYKATDIPSFLTIDGHAQLQNLRGNMPQHTTGIGSTDYQQASALTVANIANWNSITSCTSFEVNAFDPTVPNLHVSYAQDFMANNRGLNTIITTQSAIGPSYWQAGYRDTTWTISRLKSDWNTYFTELQDIEISDEHWNREDLSQLKKLKKFILVAGNIYHSNDQTVNGATNYVNSIPASVLDSILIQIDRGAGQTVTGGTIYLIAGPGTGRTSASDAAVADLRAKGWYVYANGTN
jgi:YD repeat-containing protein